MTKCGCQSGNSCTPEHLKLDTTTAPTEWTAKDDEIIRQYKEDVKSGKLHPVEYKGNLSELIRDG